MTFHTPPKRKGNLIFSSFLFFFVFFGWQIVGADSCDRRLHHKDKILSNVPTDEKWEFKELVLYYFAFAGTFTYFEVYLSCVMLNAAGTTIPRFVPSHELRHSLRHHSRHVHTGKNVCEVGWNLKENIGKCDFNILYSESLLIFYLLF